MVGSHVKTEVGIPGPGVVMIGSAMVANPGLDARIRSVELVDSRRATLVGFGLRLPNSAVGDDGELVPSVQIFLGVDFAPAGRFEAVRVHYEVDSEQASLLIQAAAQVD